jgi:HSP20 family molecular chaperone IbpA
MEKNTKPENTPSKELAAQKATTIKPVKKPTKLAHRRPQTDIDQALDDAIDRFRQDFADLIFPTEEILVVPEVRTPAVDLQEREKDFILKAEMPGFKKDEIEINVQEDGVEISGASGWQYDEDEESYICKERACKSFYRYVELPEEIKVDDVSASLADGVLEVTLQKKAPKPQKQRRKVQVK